MPKVDLSDMDIQALIDDEDGAIDNGHLPMRPMHDDDAIDRDHAVVYDQRTGVSSLVRKYKGNGTLAHMLSKRDQATGERIFRTSPPSSGVAPGQWPCWLHPDHARYEEFVGQGFPNCGKTGYFATAQDVEQHVRAKHTRIHTFVREQDAARERAAERDGNQQMLEAIMELAKKGQTDDVPAAVSASASRGKKVADDAL